MKICVRVIEINCEKETAKLVIAKLLSSIGF